MVVIKMFIFYTIYLSTVVNSVTHLILSYNQLGQFIEAIGDPFFQQILNKRTAAANGNQLQKIVVDNNQQWANVDEQLRNIGTQTGTLALIDLINAQIDELGKKIDEKVHQKYCVSNGEEEKMGQEKCQEMQQETRARLKVRQLYKMTASYLILKITAGLYSDEMVKKSKLFTWWYQFRYHVNSGAILEDGITRSEIRQGMKQYYDEKDEEMLGFIQQFDINNAFLNDILSSPLNSSYNNSLVVELSTNDDKEQHTFNSLPELSQEKLAVLIHKPKDKEIPVYALIEKSPIMWQMLGVNHRAIKVYGIEFHFALDSGIYIGGKIRFQEDNENGIKSYLIGYTKKSQWEVQKIFDEFNDFYMENSEPKNGKFTFTKYELRENNCIHFSEEFEKKLCEGTKPLKRRWLRPRMLKQPIVNKLSKALPDSLLEKVFPTGQLPTQ